MPRFEYGLRRSGYKNPSSPRFLRSESSNDKLDMHYQLGALAACTAIFVYALLRRQKKSFAVRDVPGPVNPSWIFGTSQAVNLGFFTPSCRSMALNAKIPKDTSGISRPKKLGEQRRGSSRDLGTSLVGTAPLGYMTSFIGQTPADQTIGACVQEDRLWIADPKAINHILHKSGYLYAKPTEVQEQSALFNDHGIASVEGESRTTSVLACFWLVQRCCRRGTYAPQEGDGSGLWSR